MIVTTDIQNIVFDLCRVFGIKVMQTGVIPTEPITEERCVVIAKTTAKGKIWDKTTVEANLVVPDIGREANLIRLQELERKAEEVFGDSILGLYDGDTWRIEKQSSGIMADRQSRTHYVNCHLQFQVLNFTH